MIIQKIYNSAISIREDQVLQLIATEHTTKEIADKLFISDHTVISHRKSLMDKMGAKNTAGLVRRGFEYGLLRTRAMLLIGFVLFGGIGLMAQERANYKEGERPEAISETIGLEVSKNHIVLFGDSIRGGGSKMMWIPSKSAIRAGRLLSSSKHWDVDSIGDDSAIFGYENESSADNATLFGSFNTVNKPGGVAWGFQNTVNDDYGTSWGTFNTINKDGNYVTAWGAYNEVKGTLGTVWGNRNSSNSELATIWGFENNIDSLAAVASTVWGSGNNVNGRFATAWGTENRANGKLATSFGMDNTTDGDLAAAWGEANQANGERSTVWGNSNIINSIGATSWGTNNRIEADDAFNATVWGLNNIVEGNRATAWGSSNSAPARDATTWGNTNNALGISSTAFGTANAAKGGASLAIGSGNTANGYASTTLGVYAKPIAGEVIMTGIPTPITQDYPLFVIGNGSLNVLDISNPFRSNAVVVSKSGRVGINQKFGLPNADLHIKSSEPYTGASVPNRSTGGIVMEDAGSDAFWQINIANGDLHFSRGDVLKARLLEDGTWEAKGFNEVNPILSRINEKKSTAQLNQIIVAKNKEGKITLDEQSLLKTNPEFISFDREGSPQSIDYKQLYLLAVNEIQEQAKVIRKQSTKLATHDDRLLQLEKLIKDK